MHLFQVYSGAKGYEVVGVDSGGSLQFFPLNIPTGLRSLDKLREYVSNGLDAGTFTLAASWDSSASGPSFGYGFIVTLDGIGGVQFIHCIELDRRVLLPAMALKALRGVGGSSDERILDQVDALVWSRDVSDICLQVADDWSREIWYEPNTESPCVRISSILLDIPYSESIAFLVMLSQASFLRKPWAIRVKDSSILLETSVSQGAAVTASQLVNLVSPTVFLWDRSVDVPSTTELFESLQPGAPQRSESEESDLDPGMTSSIWHPAIEGIEELSDPQCREGMSDDRQPEEGLGLFAWVARILRGGKD